MILTLIEAMGRMEGVLVQGSRAQRNNNPGNLEWGPFTKAHGATGGDPRFAIFPSIEVGYAAMRTLLLAKYASETIEEMISQYAPANENNVSNYTHVVCELVGCEPTTVVKDLMF